jgi:hypothetical protein
VLHPSNWGISDSIQLRAAVLAVGAFFLVWFVSMAITGLVARRQGRDDGLWAVLAFFLGPLALLVLLVAPRSSLRRAARDPTTEIPTAAPAWRAHDKGWVELTYGPSITLWQRLLGAVVGGALAGGLAGVLSLAGGDSTTSVAPVVWSMAGAVVGYVLSGALIDAEGGRVIGVGVVAGALAIAVAELLARLMGSMPDLSGGALAIFDIVLVAVSSILFPIVYALFAQGLLAAALVGGLIWATLTQWLLRLGSEHVEPVAAGG